ncbi:type II secretion system F family protein [Bradyrhizobium sp. LHD-71]|uniref:type II secretion system F family protein n=1 Tax=Bradyrhizobium sp. LHD-71 TaxID=3072141 RepID=UPI00280E9FBA|nr:type II secretion system F family protein [Bradyrhizobium sp. LHD-71]MDQ8727008.1 type II secretion system F family protein [Bradyrhizobium sp. LHD-71]
MNLQTLALAFMAATAIGGLAWVFLYPMLSGERQAEQRRASFARSEPIARRSDRVQRTRRQQVEASLKDVENRHKQSKKIPLTNRISQAGLSWTMRQFVIISVAMGVSCFLVVLLMGGGLLPSAAFGFAAGFGAPRWFLGYMKKRRELKFLEGLPDAVDIIVRGIKAGLPLFDSIKLVAADSQEPVRGEFAAIVETQAIGMPLGDACARLYERMPVAEANFFGIVISIQQTAGGNLSEALGNLSKVLRDRKKMKAKIKAMSMEAKASAAIIGSLPPVIMLALYALNPGYISLLWTTPMGRLMLLASAVWMTIGVLVMRKMINFDF